MEDRHSAKSSQVTSQRPSTQWHNAVGDATLADVILACLLHYAHKLKLKGKSTRKLKSELTEDQHLVKHANGDA
jgi:hypothetical protein